MTCENCGHYAFSVIAEDKISCHECGYVQEESDCFDCDQCGQTIESGNAVDHYIENHGLEPRNTSEEVQQPE